MYGIGYFSGIGHETHVHTRMRFGFLFLPITIDCVKHFVPLGIILLHW